MKKASEGRRKRCVFGAVQVSACVEINVVSLKLVNNCHVEASQAAHLSRHHVRSRRHGQTNCLHTQHLVSTAIYKENYLKIIDELDV